MAFDASPSWSGFNYQGKIALYHTLTLINNRPIDTDFSDWSLLLENIEDFEIVEGNTSKSLHQVKAYNSNSYSNYSDALLEITLELSKNNSASGFIHTWKKVGFKKNTTNLINSIKDDLIELLSHYSPMPRNGASLIEKAVSNKTGIPKTAAIIRTAFKDKTADEIHSIIDAIYDGKDNSLSRLATYIYDDGNDYCDLDAINEKIKLEITKVLAARGLVDSEEQVDRTFHYLLGMMDKYVTTRHKQKQSDEKTSIQFSYIIQVLMHDHEVISRSYMAFKFKEFFALKIDEYMADDDDYVIPVDMNSCNLTFVRNHLMSLTPAELWSYYRSFTPQTYLDHSSNIKNAFEVDAIGIRHVLIKIFHLLNYNNSHCDTDRFKIIYKPSFRPVDTYLPTTITNTIPATRIAKQITSNKGVNELLYEIRNVIYNGDVLHQFSPTLDSNSQAPLEFGSELREKHIEPLQLINLVPIQTAKDALS